jgi:small conductance mechanosensitive channel
LSSGTLFTALSQNNDPHAGRTSVYGPAAARLREVGLTLGLSPAAARRARRQLLVFIPLFAGAIVLWVDRVDIFGLPNCTPGSGKHSCGGYWAPTALQIGVVITLVIVGWQLARAIGRGLTPLLSRWMDEGTAGTTGFLIRLASLVISLVVALVIANVSVTAIAIGASFSAVIVGLAAQQTLGNLIAGLVLLTARPFRVGDTVRLQVGILAGQIEGMVTELGLMYTTFNAGGDPVLVPNSAVLAAAVRPLHEPEAVSLRVRLSDGRTPIELQKAIEAHLTVPVRRHPRVILEEVSGAEVIVRVSVAPRNPGDGGRLASELLEAVSREGGVDGDQPEADA